VSSSTPPKTYSQPRFARPRGATDLLLIRHGEAAVLGDEEPFPTIGGQGDPGLSNEGRRQAELVAGRLAHEEIDVIYVSNLRRTAQTAAPLAEQLGLQPRVEADLREVYLGEWEGALFRKMVAEHHPAATRLWREERWDVIPGAEAGDLFSARVRGVFDRIVTRHPDQRVAVFCHGAVIGQILAEVSEAKPFTFVHCDNGSISQLVVARSRAYIRRFNDTAHLTPTFSLEAEPPT